MNDFKKCFANLDKGKECGILTEKLCETTGRCPFYKSSLQYTTGQALAKLRNRKLGILSLSGKYEPNNEARRNYFNKIKEEVGRWKK